MKRAEEEYKEEDLKVIWLGFQDAKEKIVEFMIKHDIDSSLGYDNHNIIASSYGIVYGAGLIAIDKEGIVRKKIPKGFSGDGLVEALRDVVYVDNSTTVQKGEASN